MIAGLQQLVQVLVTHHISRRWTSEAGRRRQRGQIDAFLSGVGMLTHERLDARALAALQRFDNRVVLTMGQ